MTVRNLFPYRATDKRELLKVDCPTGGERGWEELLSALTADTVVAAWGGWVPFRFAEQFETLIKRNYKLKSIYCLGTNGDGSPKHPLYLPKSTELQPFWNNL